MIIKLLILFISLIINIYKSEAQTSGGGPTTHSPTISVTDGVTTCYPYQIQVGSVSSCTNGVVTIGGGGGSGTVNAGTIGQAAYYASSGTAVNGTNSLIFTSSGNIGINSSNPGKTLDVQGTIRITGTSGSIPLDVEGTLSNSFFAGNVGIGTPATSRVLAVASSSSNTGTTNTSTASISVSNLNTTDNNMADIAYNTRDLSGASALGAKMEAVFTSHTGGAVSADMAWVLKNAGTNAERMRLTSAGNVGIGSSVPGTVLDVNGTARMGGFTMNQGSSLNNKILTSDSSGNGTWQTASSGSGTVNSGTAGNVAFYASSTTAVSGTSTLFFDGSGNIGISSVNPGQILDVQGTIRSIGALFSNGNVGIGSQTPGSRLDVQGSIRSLGTQPSVSIGTSSVTNYLNVGSTNGFRVDSTGAIVALGNSTSATLSANTWNLSQSGSSATLQNNQSTSGSGLQITGSAATNGLLNLRSTSSASASGDQIAFKVGVSAGTDAIRIVSSGNVGIGSTLPGAMLDVKGTLRLVGPTAMLVSRQATSPTVASNDCGSTSQGTVVANSTDLSGTVTVGTLAVTSCAVTYNSTFVVAPNCICMDDSSVLAVRCIGTTTKLTITSAASMSGDNITWWCPSN